MIYLWKASKNYHIIHEKNNHIQKIGILQNIAKEKMTKTYILHRYNNLYIVWVVLYLNCIRTKVK